MTDRLGELRKGAPSEPGDIEAGLDLPAAEANLDMFNREADAIEKDIIHADRSIRTITSDLSDPEALPSVTAQLDAIDSKFDAIRKHLGRIADENRQMAVRADSSLTTLKHRVNRFTKLSKDFMDATAHMETARERHRDVVTDRIKRDILAANPHATETAVEYALQGGDLQAVLHEEDVHLDVPIEELRTRNQDIQKLSKNIVELHNMFADMSLLGENQQELIHGIETNVKEVHQTTKKAEDELEIAHKLQKAARKKKWCCISSVIVILLAVAGGIIVWQGLRNDWFGGGNDSRTSLVLRGGLSNRLRHRRVLPVYGTTVPLVEPRAVAMVQERKRPPARDDSWEGENAPLST